MKSTYIFVFALWLGAAATSSCKKKEVYDSPYTAGKSPLGVSLSMVTLPEPQEGTEGTEVTFAGTGLLPYKSQLIFMFNGQQAEIKQVTETGITVKVPKNASTGVATVRIDDQVFFGPRFKIAGKIYIDPEFRVKNGADEQVNFALPVQDGRFIIVGAFTDYDGKGLIKPVNRIVRTFSDGTTDATFRSGGANGTLQAIASLNQKYIIGGSFSGFYSNNGNSILTNIKNITRLNVNGEVDSILVNTYTTTNSAGPNLPATGRKKAVPAFNGGVTSAVNRLFVQQNKIIAVGNFDYYVSNRYDLPKKPVIIGGATYIRDSIVTDSTEIHQLVRLNEDGSLDKAFRFNSTSNTALEGASGSLGDSYMQADGKLIVTGAFKKFDAVSAGGIVRLNVDGTVDPTFKAGAGADRSISSITFNPVNQKYVITGSFTTYDGKSAKGIALLNADGSLDNSFSSKGISANGSVTYAKQLSNGLIIAGGSFESYDNVRRPGLMVLNPAGELAPGYNAIGGFDGYINQVLQTTNANGDMAVMIMGVFRQIDGIAAQNVSRLILEN